MSAEAMPSFVYDLNFTYVGKVLLEKIRAFLISKNMKGLGQA